MGWSAGGEGGSPYPFLIALMAAALLSLEGLNRVQQGVVWGLYPLRHTGSALTVGGLGFFLCQAARAMAQADGSDPVAVRSARSNLLAATLVFLAAGIRFDDVQFLRAQGRFPDCPQSEEMRDTWPDTPSR